MLHTSTQRDFYDKADFANKLGFVEVSMNLNWTDPRLIALALALVVIVAVVAWMYVRKRRSTTAGLRQKFGPEYDRAVLAHGSKAEAKLADREKRIDKLNIRDLDAMEHERYSKQWQAVQSRFVDSPKGAVAEADDLVCSVMKVRGYPVADFGRPSSGRRKLPVGPRDCAPFWKRGSNHRRSQNSDDSLPLAV